MDYDGTWSLCELHWKVQAVYGLGLRVQELMLEGMFLGVCYGLQRVRFGTRSSLEIGLFGV